MRQVILFALVVVLAALAVASTATGAADRSACSNGMMLLPVPQNETQLRQLPRIAAGLDANPAPYTVADLVALGNQIDENGDGVFCLKAVSNLRGESVKIWGFFYGARDNQTSAS